MCFDQEDQAIDDKNNVLCHHQWALEANIEISRLLQKLR